MARSRTGVIATSASMAAANRYDRSPDPFDRPWAGGLAGGQRRQQQRDRGAASLLAFNAQGAARAFGEATRAGQAKPGALAMRLGGEEQHAGLRQNRGRHADA